MPTPSQEQGWQFPQPSPRVRTASQGEHSPTSISREGAAHKQPGGVGGISNFPKLDDVSDGVRRQRSTQMDVPYRHIPYFLHNLKDSPRATGHSKCREYQVDRTLLRKSPNTRKKVKSKLPEDQLPIFPQKPLMSSPTTPMTHTGTILFARRGF